MLQWTTPAMLAGAALIALPLIAHWLNRSSRRTVVFPTLQFLLAVTASENRWLKFRRLLLLLLRCLLILLAVAAFARPVWLAGPTDTDLDGRRMLVVVLDNSVSTTQVVDGASVHGRLVAAAVRALGQLTLGRDEAVVIVAEAQPRALLRGPTSNLEYLSGELNGLQPSLERADWEAALNTAARVIVEAPGRLKKQIVVLTDLQQSNWQTDQRISGQDLKLPADCQIQIVDLAVPSAANVALGSPQALPSDPLPGQSLQLSVMVHNFSPQIQQTPVTLRVDGLPLQTQTVTLDPWQAQIASFSYSFDPEAGQEFDFQIPADALLADNHAYLCLQPGKRVPVALLCDDLVNQPGSSAFFLDRALQPFASDADRFEVKPLRPRSLESGALAGFRAVVVGDVRDWSATAGDELVRFTRMGGRLLYFCGGGNVPRGLRAVEQAAGEPVFPFLVQDYQRWRQVEQMPAIKNGQWRGRWLREFDLASQFALQQIRFPAAWSVAEVRADSEVIMSFADDRPALAYRAVGAGAVLQANLSPGIEAGEFGKYAAFAALVQILVRQFLSETAEVRGLPVGNSLFFQTPWPASPAGASILDPTGKSVPLATGGGTGNSAAPISLERARIPGFYGLRIGGQIVETQAVNLDVRESDLRCLPASAIGELLKQSGSRVVADATSSSTAILDDGYSLWPWLLALGMVALLIESLLVGLWRR